MAAPASKTPVDAGGVADLEKLPIARVLAKLDVVPEQGLGAAEAALRLTKHGPNALAEKETSLARKLLGHFTGPIAYMIEAAAAISAVLGHWSDFAIIAGLLFFNAALEFWQDRKASNALAALKKGLAPVATVKRDGKWATVDAANLVPGDIVEIRLGVIVPADLRLIGGDYAAIDQAALTGESLPATKKIGDVAYSGSIVRQGDMQGVVIATGGDTFFGRTAKLVAGAGAVSHAQKAMFAIGNFLIVLAVALALIMVVVKVYTDIVISDDWDVEHALGILQFVLVLLVASIPVAMPAVFSITMALGRARAVEGEGDRHQAVRHRGDGGGRHSLLRQDGDADQEPAHGGRADSVRREVCAGLHPRRGARIEGGGPRRHRYRGVRRSDRRECARGFQAREIRAVRSREQAHRGDGQRRCRQDRDGHQGRAAGHARSCQALSRHRGAGQEDRRRSRGQGLARARRRPLRGCRSYLVAARHSADVRPAPRQFQAHHRARPGEGRRGQDGDRGRHRDRHRDRAPARHGHPHHSGGGRVSEGHGPQQRAAGDRRGDRAGGRLRPGLPRAQIRDRQGAAVARPSRRHDRRRRQRRAGIEAGGLRHGGVRGDRRRPQRRRAGADRARTVGDRQRDRRGAPHLRADHELHHLPGGADHGHHVPGRDVDGVSGLRAAHRRHDRDHVAS